MEMTLGPYRGRFAPSPTGPLHFGSLVAALASRLEAFAHGGEWQLRIEDVDRPRCSMAAAETILRQLEAYGFAWDGEVIWQSRRDEAYAEALEQLRLGGHVFPCACTRKELADAALAPDGAALYPGTCRTGLPPGRSARAWRLAVGAAQIQFDDAIQGPLHSDLAGEVGDFILRRADGLYAYQLAVVVDDAAAGVTHVVRGADLLDSTARQIHLQHCLGVSVPVYAHVPVAVNAAGEKLSKQTLAPALNADPAAIGRTLCAALEFLGQNPPSPLAEESPAAIWQWAQNHWRLTEVPRRRTQTFAGVSA